MENLYQIGVTCRPKSDDDYDTPRFLKAGKRLGSEFTKQFKGKFSCIEIKKAEEPSLPYPEGTTPDKMLLLEVHKWVRKGAAGVADGADLHVFIDVPKAPQSLAHARWVDLTSRNLTEVKPEYRVICPECARERPKKPGEWPINCTGALDTDHPPDPLKVDGKHLKQPLKEFYRDDNGLFFVNERVLALFEKFAAGDFTKGRVIVEGGGKLFWIRARHWTEGLAREFWEEPCPKCGAPTKRELRHEKYPDLERLLNGFGPSAPNMARVSRWPVIWGSRPTVETVVSGGLFAALFNHDVKGLVWPEAGPYISMRPDEPTWEKERRFGGEFSGNKDKFLKKKIA